MRPESEVQVRGGIGDATMESVQQARIRVAINALTDLTLCYGSRVYLMALARELSRLPEIELLLMVGKAQTSSLPQDLQLYAREVDVPVARSYWQLLFHDAIRKALARAKVDIWHLPNSLPLLNVPTNTIMTIHDLVDLRVHKYRRIRTAYRLMVNRMGARHADHIVTVSENSKRDIIQLLNVPKEKITVVYPGVDETFHPLDPVSCKSYLRSNYSIEEDFILAPGGLAPNKNVEGLLAAFQELYKLQSNYVLVLTGRANSSRQKAIARRLNHLGLKGRVHLTGNVPANDMPRFYCASSVVTYLSLYEGFGLPVLEAMACGVPVVASQASSIPEAAGSAALLVDPLDTRAIAMALKRVLNDHELRARLVARGRERAARFPWKRTALEITEIYLRLLRGPRFLLQ